jgi:trigger factor
METGEDMKVDVIEQEDKKKKLTFEIPQDVITEELGKIYREINSTAKIKGFRPGKVPKAILKRFFWARIESEVIQNLVPSYYRQAISEANLDPIGEPKFDDFFVEEGKPLSVGVTLEVKPVIEPKDYTNIEIKWQKNKAMDEDVLVMLTNLQEKNAQFEVVEDRPVQEGDIVFLDYEGTVDGKPIDKKKNEDVQIEINSKDEKSDFVKALIGLSKGETKRIDVTIPENFSHKELSGKACELNVIIKEIKEKKIPALDDEFARDLGEYDDLESLKKEIREKIQSSMDSQAENIAKEKLINTLIERNPFDPPESMIESRIDDIIAGIENQLRLGGNYLNTDKWDRDKVREELRSRAKKDVHLALIQEGIARKEGLNISEEEIEKQIELLSLQTKQDFDELKNRAKTEGSWDKIRTSLLMDKAMDFVMNKAIRIEVQEGADENIREENIKNDST